ncbi:MAG: DNA mismatch repair endonuclease MutL [Thermoanaerobaculia bacterium]
MSRIRILSDHLVSQIAAGEVVERPASVVKELLENALDAGARRLAIELEAGGKRRIRVTDDGSGMDSEDALLAFDRHATSKIAQFTDLERVATLGFRGEALASIAAVARVELTTATAPGDGHRVRIEGGRIVASEPAARDRGTTVEVASLFSNVPARRKFLKSPQTELRRAVEVVQGYALARPDVAFRLQHEGRELLQVAAAGEGSEGARRRIGELFSHELVEHLVPIEGGALGGRIWGFVGDRETTHGRRLFLFVNRRLLRDRALLATFYRAVREQWHQEEFPALFLFLDLPPDSVDVNVHPQKAEVRLRDPRLTDHVGDHLRDALARARGEEAAPLRNPYGMPSAPLAWQGAGSIAETSSEATTPFRTSSASGAGQREAIRLANLTLSPLERAPVPLSGRSGEVRPFRLLGQYKGTLILLEGPDGLYVIDQHVAHERILYERFRRALEAQDPPRQTLLEPVVLDLSRPETLRLGELGEELAGCGFELSELSGGSLGLTAIPAPLSLDAAEGILRRLASDGADEQGADALRRQLLDALAASRACRAAIKMHEPLTAEAMESLVTELFQAEQPYACPHGRPVVLTMTDADLEHRFGRR